MGDDTTKSKENTFQFEDTLSSLPLPLLEDTLRKYLDSVKVFATEEEYINTKNIVEEFQNGEGRKIQDKLEEKAKTSRNWLEKWWEDLAYLSVREPLAVTGCMAGLSPMIMSYWPPEEVKQLKRASQSIHGYARYYTMLRREEIPVMRSKSGSVFSMHQYRNFFCTSRIPGEEKDEMVYHFKTASEGPCPSHCVVFCNGHIFTMNLVDEDGNAFGSYEYERQLTSIKDRSRERGQCVGVLTADDRTSWAKMYSYLSSLDPKNAENLKLIQSATSTITLDDTSPKTQSEVVVACMAGRNPQDHWFDKSSGVVYCANGTVGYSADHCPYEGVVIIDIELWVDKLITECQTDWIGSPDVQSDDIVPEEIFFKLDSKVEEAKVHAAETYHNLAKRMDICVSDFTLFGRNFAKEQQIHPDIFFQLAIQLAYYNKYGKTVPCYETATSRQYYHGRTETIRVTTQESVNWCKAMGNSDISAKDKMNLLRQAAGKHMMVAFDSLQGKGIDRHLLGIYAASQEMGMFPPGIFLDPCFVKSGGNGNFVLSTSLIGYNQGIGGVAPMRPEGYGVFYNLCKEHFFMMVTSFKDCEDTNSIDFFQQITKALVQMESMCLEAKL